MTAADKRDRRQAHHEVQAAFKRHVIQRMGLHSTGPQIRSAIKQLTDRYYAETINPAVKLTLSELAKPRTEPLSEHPHG
jgi:hypothetical protein